jgi:hypothetical protein
VRTVVLLALTALAFPATARADDAAALYDPADVAVVDLSLSGEAIEALAGDPGEYVDATFSLAKGDLAFGPKPVEVRLKGQASFRPLGQKAAFKVKFPKANRLLGLKSMTLNNMVQDPSMVHETLGYEILRAAGVPAARTGFAYVRVNGRGYGLYLDLETYDDISLARLFDTTQHLYEADGYGVDVVPGGAGAYEVDEGDEDDRADLEALIAAVNATGGDWSDGLAATADLDEMTRLWAGEQYIGQWDGYSAMAGRYWPNNYYLHSDEAGRFSMLASGLDQAFVRRWPPVPGEGDGLLVAGCRADSSCLAAYRARLADVSAAADAIGVGARLDAIAATVARWRPCVDLEHDTDARWQAAVTETRTYVRDRRNEVADYLGAAAPAPDPALESTAPPPLSGEGCPSGDDPEPPPATPTPTPTLTPQPESPAAAASAVAGATAARLRPRRLSAHAKLRRHRLTTWGFLRLPAGVGGAGTCHGRGSVRVRAGRRTLALRRTALRFDCTYRTTVPLKTRRKSLAVQVRFLGNAELLPRSAATTRPRA